MGRTVIRSSYSDDELHDLIAFAREQSTPVIDPADILRDWREDRAARHAAHGPPPSPLHSRHLRQHKFVEYDDGKVGLWRWEPRHMQWELTGLRTAAEWDEWSRERIGDWSKRGQQS